MLAGPAKAAKTDSDTTAHFDLAKVANHSQVINRGIHRTAHPALKLDVVTSAGLGIT